MTVVFETRTAAIRLAVSPAGLPECDLVTNALCVWIKTSTSEWEGETAECFGLLQAQLSSFSALRISQPQLLKGFVSGNLIGDQSPSNM